MSDTELTLAQAIKQAKEAEKVAAKAQIDKEKAEAMVAKVRSAESKEKIMKSLDQIIEYTKSIGEFDNELRKEVKTKVKKIVRYTFGDNWNVSKKAPKITVTKLKFINAEVGDVLKEMGAIGKDNAVTRKEIESEVGIRHGDIGDCAFDSNAWSKRDTSYIKSIGVAKKKCYYVD